MVPTFDLETTLRKEGYRYIVGTDEAGRGSLSGPVVAAAVSIPEGNEEHLLGLVNDSKKMSAKKREDAYELITKYCNYGVQEIGPEVIDNINILEATKLAMKSSIEQLEYFDYVIIDGTVDLSNHIFCTHKNLIGGDSLSLSVAAASVIAKVTRDRIMDSLHAIYPIYGWVKNKGYGTKEHIDAIKIYGATDYHRLSFNKVKT